MPPVAYFSDVRVIVSQMCCAITSGRNRPIYLSCQRGMIPCKKYFIPSALRSRPLICCAVIPLGRERDGCGGNQGPGRMRRRRPTVMTLRREEGIGRGSQRRKRAFETKVCTRFSSENQQAPLSWMNMKFLSGDV